MSSLAYRLCMEVVPSLGIRWVHYEDHSVCAAVTATGRNICIDSCKASRRWVLTFLPEKQNTLGRYQGHLHSSVGGYPLGLNHLFLQVCIEDRNIRMYFMPDDATQLGGARGVKRCFIYTLYKEIVENKWWVP